MCDEWKNIPRAIVLTRGNTVILSLYKSHVVATIRAISILTEHAAGWITQFDLRIM